MSQGGPATIRFVCEFDRVDLLSTKAARPHPVNEESIAAELLIKHLRRRRQIVSALINIAKSDAKRLAAAGYKSRPVQNHKPDPAAWYIHSACRSPGLIRRG